MIIYLIIYWVSDYIIIALSLFFSFFFLFLSLIFRHSNIKYRRCILDKVVIYENTTNVIKIFRYLLHSGRLFYRMARHVTKESNRSSSMIKIILSFRDSLRATCLRHVSSLFFSVSTNRLKSNALRDIRQTSLTSVRLIALIKCARYIRPCESRNWDLALFYLEHVWFLSFILELIPELNLTFRNFVSLKRIHSCVAVML